MKYFALVVLLLIGLQFNGNTQEGYKIPEHVERIVFLGNSITYSGQYVDYVETILTANNTGKKYEIINVGLPSETVSGLSEPNHAGGRFPRPDLHERLDRIMKQIQPDLIFACYGMNDGIYMPLDEHRFQKFKNGTHWLHNEAIKAGASIVHLTPPVFDAKNASFTSHGEAYAGVLDTYSDWLISCREKEGWDVIDIHWPMQKFLEEKRKADPDFRFAKDGVHPDEIGHWIMARPILLALGEKEIANAESIEEALNTLSIAKELQELISKRQKIRKDAWLTATGHERPGMKEGLPLKEAQQKALEIEKEIHGLESGAKKFSKDTFKPIVNDKVPQTVEELWQDFDPRAEPLDVEILYEWEEEGVVMKVLRYRIGIFKGQKAMMAAVYGYPKGAKNLPGLVQIHGGGQYADYRAVLTNAKRGYATISISWAGRINAPDYKVTPDIVKLFWENKTDAPNYKVTTDWGAVDGYHAPCRNPENKFGAVSAAFWTLDAVESPRNNSWFLCAVGARRALTFLEQQPEVNPYKLGVYGHSMGGKLTVLTASDPRVKAAAPSCGGISDNDNESQLYQNTISDNAYLKQISCPIIFLKPANDFHGHLSDLPIATDLIKSKEWRAVSAPHHNHQDLGQSEVTGLLWFDQYLKGTFTYPKTPESILDLKTKNGVPVFTVKPDPSIPILEVDIYYTQQGENVGDITDRENRINRFWHHAKASKKGGKWIADLPLLNTDRPLWAYANIKYALNEKVSGAGYYYGIYSVEAFNLSTLVHMHSSEELRAAGVKKTMNPSLIIETFKGDWEKEWFTYKPEFWSRRTHKVYNDKWKAPENGKLSFEVRSEEPNKMVVGIDKYATEIQLSGGSKWQRIILSPKDFQNALGEFLPGWTGIMELRLGTKETLREKIDFENKKLDLGAEWTGKKPEFRNLCWKMDLK